MSAVGLESIEHTVQLKHVWINELDAMLGWNDKHRSYRLFRSVLRASRDWLPVNEAADFAAQLPGLLRDVCYEQWRPATTPVKHHSRADFPCPHRSCFRGRFDQTIRRRPSRSPFNSCRARSAPARWRAAR